MDVSVHTEELDGSIDTYSNEPEAIGLTSFPLSMEVGRLGFLRHVYDIGYDALFEAVAHLWDSLAEPRDQRCQLIGLASGAGGSAKVALYLTLKQFIDDGLASIEPLPDRADFDSFESWSAAALATFATDEHRIAELCATYSRILDGQPTAPAADAMNGRRRS